LWKSRGRPLGTRRHRCEYWAQTIGGILEACGFPEFLGNAAEAAAEFNSELGDVAALAETVVRTANSVAYTRWQDGQPEEVRDDKPAGAGLPAGEWFNIFRGAKVEIERLDAAKSAQARATIMGSFLARMLGREVRIEVDGSTGRATLRMAPGRGNKKLYWFDVSFDGDQPGDDTQSPSDKGAPRKLPRDVPKKPQVESRYSPINRRPAPGMVPAGNNEAW